MQKMIAKPDFDVLFWIEPSDFGASEGLVVLLSDLIKGLSNISVKTRLHVSERHRYALSEGLRKNDVPFEHYEICVYRVVPALLNNGAKSKPKSYRSYWPSSWLWIRRLEALLVYSVSRAGKWTLRVMLLALIVASTPLLPVILVVLAAVGIRQILRWIGGGLRGRAQAVVRQSSLLRSLSTRFQGWRHKFVRRSYKAALVVERARLARAVNGSADVRRVFVPFCFCGAALAEIDKPKIVVFPDVTPAIFPTRFLGHFGKDQVANFSESVRWADSLICYSREIADNQLMQYFAQEAADKPVHVVPQGFFLTPAKEDPKPEIMQFVNHFHGWCSYIPKYSLDEIDYVVYPSVDRPHKNVLTLLRAVEILLRRKQMNIKFVTTSHYVSPEAEAFIIKNRMFFDALYTTTLDSASLDGLIARARLIVHPSLAEGGDIFNFSRAVAAGVPALLADIPVVREMFDRWDIPKLTYEPWLFSATDAEALAELIARSINQRANIIVSQQDVHRRLLKYNFTAMASRYYDIYASTAKSRPGHAGGARLPAANRELMGRPK